MNGRTDGDLVREAISYIRDEWEGLDGLIGDAADFVPLLEDLAHRLDEEGDKR